MQAQELHRYPKDSLSKNIPPLVAKRVHWLQDVGWLPLLVDPEIVSLPSPCHETCETNIRQRCDASLRPGEHARPPGAIGGLGPMSRV